MPRLQVRRSAAVCGVFVQRRDTAEVSRLPDVDWRSPISSEAVREAPWQVRRPGQASGSRNFQMQ
jgi:hypothetical protein